MSHCLCCNSCLLRHIRHGEMRWFCSSCWQDMPNCEGTLSRSSLDSLLAAVNRATPLQHAILVQN